MKSREHGPEKNYKGPGKVLEFCQADSVGTMLLYYKLNVSHINKYFFTLVGPWGAKGDFGG